MIEVSQLVTTGADQVFEVLADGWLYPLWVVGASHMREVDEDWPAAGSKLHHSVGPWPLQIRDATTVTAIEPNRMLELEQRVWPTGTARVRLTLDPAGPDQTRVTLGEVVERGPARELPVPVQAAMIRPRNVEALRRLADIAEHRDVVCTPRPKARVKQYEDPELGSGVRARQQG